MIIMMHNHDLRVVFTRNICSQITGSSAASDGHTPVGNSLSSVSVVANRFFMDLWEASLQNETHDRSICLLEPEGPINCVGEQCLNDICSEHCPDKDCKGDTECRDCRQVRLRYVNSGDLNGRCETHNVTVDEKFRAQWKGELWRFRSDLGY